FALALVRADDLRLALDAALHRREDLILRRARLQLERRRERIQLEMIMMNSVAGRRHRSAPSVPSEVVRPGERARALTFAQRALAARDLVQHPMHPRFVAWRIGIVDDQRELLRVRR